MKLSIIIPIYNEARFIDAVIEKIKRVILPRGLTKEIIVVDDGSTDGTVNILRKYKLDPMVKTYYKSKNHGKSAAVKTGIEKSDGDIIIIQDADLEYSPLDYPRLVAPIIENKSAVVYGSRFKGRIKKMDLLNRMANALSNITVNLLFGSRLTDVNTCYKAFKREAFDKIEIASGHFAFETEITSKLLKQGYRIYEVPISYEARSKKEGKKMSWCHALKMYWGIIKYRFSSV